MSTIESKITAEYDGFIVKDYLRKVLQISSRKIKKLKAMDDGILLNSHHAIVVDKLCKGDMLSISFTDEEKSYDFSEIEPDIIFEDEYYLYVNKPANMTVYKCGDVKENLLSSVCGYYSKLGKNLVFRPFYRLDKDTTGVIVIAKDPLIMNSTEIEKAYYAVCEGEVSDCGVVSNRIQLEENSRIKRAAGQSGEIAITAFDTIKSTADFSLVKFKLFTGRTHQIRVHMSYLGHPLCGDDLYGGSMEIISRQALHCKTVLVKNSVIGYEKLVSIDFPDDMKNSFPGLCVSEDRS